MTVATASLFALTNSLMIPHHIVTLALVASCLWGLYRWGALILALYALVHFCLGQWTPATLALALAFFIATVRSGVSLLYGLTAHTPTERDDLVIEAAFNARADILVTTNERHLEKPCAAVGIRTMRPSMLLASLKGE